VPCHCFHRRVPSPPEIAEKERWRCERKYEGKKDIDGPGKFKEKRTLRISEVWKQMMERGHGEGSERGTNGKRGGGEKRGSIQRERERERVRESERERE
jgi:hypothetical protein